MNGPVTLLRDRLERAPEMLRFGLVAVVGLMVDISVAYGASLWTEIPLVLAATLGFICGACVNYALHELWTFRSGARLLSVQRGLKYAMTLGATLAVRLVAVAVLSQLFGPAHDLAVLILATSLSFGINYLTSKFLVFRPTGPGRHHGQHGQKTMTDLNDTDWDIPTHDVRLYHNMKRPYALVIPVINEGDRIRSQLERIAEAKLAIDVIVADGGSDDGSLDPAFIKTLPIRAVLIKTGPGKLSAQLRMAYAWCLREGYRGIVTIDGNGKDGVDAVTDMVAKLEEGYDYVQGSRYLPGGVAENTPLERTIANRAIHAPLLSLAGGHWFTDTTNGFRAYSASYLLDPRVQPFRSVFQSYELLFYLTVRAGQIGMKVTHVPVQRRYPTDTATPTKITGVTDKFKVLKQTFAAALGRFSPDKPSRGGLTR